MEKRCSKCKETKPIAEFNRNKSKSDGLSTECKPCVRIACKLAYEKNAPRYAEKMREHYAANKETYKERARAWEKANPELKKEMRASYRAKHRESIKEISKADWIKHAPKRRAKKKEWRQANPEKCVEHVRARQTRKARQMPEWADREAILAVYIEARRLTKETGIKHHVDHYYPLKGDLVSGLHVHFNLQAIPALDNHRKGKRMPKEHS